ncbi:hypothetical protein SLA2020_319450 [Shorea laevis]
MGSLLFPPSGGTLDPPSSPNQTEVALAVSEDFEPRQTVDEIENEDMPVNDVGNGSGGRPCVGMQFATDDDALGFYKDYAERMGFGIRKESAKRSRPDEPISRRYLVCYKAAYRRKAERAKKGIYESEDGCPARMAIHLKDGVWIIKQFFDEHNHEMVSSPKKSRKLRKLSTHNKQHALPCARESTDQNSSARCVLSNIAPQQYRERSRRKRESNISRECITVMQRFLDTAALDDRFYHSIELDEDGVCRSFFWADGRARTMYENFSDVVVFDVSYKTRQFCLPFAPFTGVNHHGQSVLFGCAFLADEQEETFVWLFERWLFCMGGKAPGAIITDHDPIIINAIQRVFPNTRHRFCIWHMSLHEDEHLHPLRSSYNPNFDEHYYRWVKSKTIEEAEAAWVTLKEKYKWEYEGPLTDKQCNEMKSWRWLESMYEKRYNWIDAYLKDIFFAGLRSSQWNEGINSFFDGYVNSLTPLHQFVEQYWKAVQCRCDLEENEDLWTMRSKPNFQGLHPLEFHVAKVYTRKIFTNFQLEFKEASFHCSHDGVNVSDGVTTYDVSYEVDDKVDTHTVQCEPSKCQFRCTCGKFETAGILCKHILYIMKQCYRWKSIPEHYILARWTLAHKQRSDNTGSAPINTSKEIEVTPLEAWNLRKALNEVYEKAIKHRALYNATAVALQDLVKQLDSIG